MQQRLVILAVLVVTALLLALAPAVSGALVQQQKNFVAHMTGDQEVPPADTQAVGQTVLRLRSNGTELHFRLIVANIENVTQAHIHLGAPGVNGPVVAWLYPDGPPPKPIPGRTNGVLAVGTITADDLVGPLEGESLDALVAAMVAGETYVNVHTQQFPPGEIRGLIR